MTYKRNAENGAIKQGILDALSEITPNTLTFSGWCNQVVRDYLNGVFAWDGRRNTPKGHVVGKVMDMVEDGSAFPNYSFSLYIPSDTTCWQDSAGTTPGAKDAVVGYLKDLVGSNHATQATAGYKPILRKGAKNLLLNSATLSTQNVTTAAIAYTLHFTGTGSVTLSGTSTAGPLNGTGANTRVSLTFTPTAGTLTLTVAGSVTNAMLEIGSSVSTYVATTSAPASNGIGPWWLDFDGTDDRLDLTSVPFQMADDHFAASSAQLVLSSVGGLNRSIFEAGAATTRICQIGTSWLGNNYPFATWVSDTSNVVQPIGSTSVLGVKLVITGRKAGTSLSARKDSQLLQDKAIAGAAWTLTGSKIGSRVSNSEFWAGAIYGLALGKGTITDSELLTVERYLAQLAGVTL